jgi:hypothetical protein
MKKSHPLLGNPQCHYALCIKKGPASLKSLCVNKLIASVYVVPKLYCVKVNVTCVLKQVMQVKRFVASIS